MVSRLGGLCVDRNQPQDKHEADSRARASLSIRFDQIC